jgi:hypothetical protein
MKPFNFRKNDLPQATAKRSVSKKQGSAQRGGDDEELSERLANLADRINEHNTARRSSGLSARYVSGYLPSFETTLAKKQGPQASIQGAELGISEQSSNADRSEETSPAFDADGRFWPQDLTAQQNNVRALEDKIAEQSMEMTKRCIQIADLCNIRQEQANELLIACDEIDGLSKSITALQQTMAQRETEAAAATQKLILSDKENLALQVKLNMALKESAELSQRLLNVETALNDKVVDIATTQEIIERLKKELAATQAETIRIAAAVEEKENRRHRDELKQQNARFENQISEIRAVVAERDRQFKDLATAHAKLTARCDNLSKIVDTFEGTQQHAQEKIKSQAEHVEFLETLLKFERYALGVKIRELIVEFQRERLQHYAKKQAFAEIRKDIAHLSPKLAVRRNGPNAPEQNSFLCHNNAA